MKLKGMIRPEGKRLDSAPKGLAHSVLNVEPSLEGTIGRARLLPIGVDSTQSGDIIQSPKRHVLNKRQDDG
jgi:hypothetical protein